MAQRPARKKVISFSLWGQTSLYLEGAVANARLAGTVYPGWVTRFHCAHDVPRATLSALREAGAEIVTMRPEPSPWAGLFWRFLPIDDPEVERMISRDVDARLNPREAACVRRWESDGCAFHVMRDHPLHHVVVPGGMFGCRGGVLAIGALLVNWEARARKNDDQLFLAARVWPLVRHDHLAHDELHAFSGVRAEDFPPHDRLVHGSFVGETIAPSEPDAHVPQP